MIAFLILLFLSPLLGVKIDSDAYIRNGSIYAINRDKLIFENYRYGGLNSRPYIMPEPCSINIDALLILLLLVTFSLHNYVVNSLYYPYFPLSSVDSILESIQNYDYCSIPLCTRSELLSYSDNLCALFTNPNKSTFRLESSLLSGLPHLKVICTASTGLNHIDVDYCSKNGIKVISLTEERPIINQITSTAEHAFALLMSSMRCIPASFSSVLSGNWDYEPFIGRQLKELTIGVVGYGRLGTLFSHYCDAFGAKVFVYDPYSNVPHPRISQLSHIHQLFEVSDVVSLHVHYSESTRGLIDKRILSFAKDDLLLVNTSRGGIVNEVDLLDCWHLIQRLNTQLMYLPMKWNPFPLVL